MPRRQTKTEVGTHQFLKNTSYESMAVSWLMQDGWQVFLPIADHGHKTDILISDGPSFFRLQIKTVEAQNKHHVVQNCWRNSHIDYVVFFARNGPWGVIAPAFSDGSRKLSHQDHRQFERTARSFLREFHLM